MISSLHQTGIITSFRQMTRRSLPLLLSGASLLFPLTAEPASAQDSASPQVKVHEGMLEGRRLTDGTSVFLGVPFAAPPVGDLRWRPAQPAGVWTGIRPATSYGAVCAQDPMALGGVFRKSSEDCLYLNLWAPDLKPRKRLPVMLYIHGGALIGGAGSIPTFNGEAYAKKGVILVTINYRLGAFGFMAHPELTAESPHRASGNYGISDQLAALQWVKANIAAFGGDPSRVTIFGQSAGSVSVMTLMASPLSRGLFRGAIGESATPLLAGRGATLAEAESNGRAFAEKVGAASLAELRHMPAEDLQKRWTAFAGLGGHRTIPVTDGWILPVSPTQVFADHREMKIPLLTGSNAREALAVPANQDLPARLSEAFGADAGKAAMLYPTDGPADPVLGTAGNMFATDMTFRCPAVVIEQWHAQQGSPTYAYHFEDSAPGQESLGSQHSAEVSHVFGSLRIMTGGRALPEAQARLQDIMVGYWTNFGKTGDPNGSGLPVWPRYTMKDQAYQRLARGTVESDRRLRGAACDLYLHSVVPKLLSGPGLL
ncbi:MAG TPA: carboxylesterase family protein [Sphingobium sp.]|uniref:carboxylesterase/lipase family protein n=1 Tax=Sphingobium sp. TaxID=1912891 RepID=UPI002ED37EFA